MIRVALRSAIWGMVLAIGGGADVGCSSTAASTEGVEAMGTVSVPLVTTTNGHIYRLRTASISIWGPTYTYLNTDGTSSQTVLSTNLRTGNYSAQLYNWTLERDDGAGNFGPVTGTLLNNTNHFTIANGATTTLVFQFQTDGVIVTVGSGRLDVKVKVDEIAPVCAPFGTDCGEGRWCPPSGLTGRALACRFHGSVDLGQPCFGPGDCIANSTCLDLGSGPVCTALCAPSSFGAACGSGDPCVRCRADYGICLPLGGDAGAPAAAPPALCPASDGGLPPDDNNEPEVDSGVWW